MKPIVTIGDAHPQSAPMSAPAGGSRIDAGLVFEGSLSGEGELTVLGTLRGSIEVRKIVVRELASVEGVIRGGEVEVRGQVEGSIQGGKVSVFKGGGVNGDITTQTLYIEPGASFEGQARHAAYAPRAAGSPDQQRAALDVHNSR